MKTEAHRYTLFLQDLNNERLKFNSQLESSPDQYNSQLSTNYLSQSVLSILHSIEKTEKRTNSQENVKKATHHPELKPRIKELVSELAALDFEIIRKRGEVLNNEDLIGRIQATSRHKTVICEQNYNQMAHFTQRNQEELENINNRLSDINKKAPEQENMLQKLKEKFISLQEKNSQLETKFSINKHTLCNDLDRLRQEVLSKEAVLSDLETEFDQFLSINKKGLVHQLNRREKEIEIAKQDIDLLQLRLKDQEYSSTNLLNELSLKLSDVEHGLDEIKSKNQAFSSRKSKEKMKLTTKITELSEKLEFPIEKPVNYSKYETLLVMNKELHEKKTYENAIFVERSEVLLKELELRGQIIKENQKKLDRMHKEYEQIEKKSKDLEASAEEKLKFAAKKIEAKKQKNKMLRNLFQNMPKTNHPLSQHGKKSLVAKEKTNLDAEVLCLNKEILDKKEVLSEIKALEEERIGEELEIVNLENEIGEIRRLVKQKQSALKQAEDFLENCRRQLNNAIR